MISAMTLDDQSGYPIVLQSTSAAGAQLLTAATGLIGGDISAPREDIADAVERHGSKNRTKWTSGKHITLSLEAWGSATALDPIADALATYRAMTAPMIATLDGAPALLKWTEGTSGLQLQRLVSLDSNIEPTIDYTAAMVSFQVTLFAEDPRAYSQTAQTATVTVPELIPNPAWVADTIGSPPANWTISGTGTYSVTVQSSTVGWGRYAKVAPNTGATVTMTSPTINVTKGVAYALMVDFAINSAAGTGVTSEIVATLKYGDGTTQVASALNGATSGLNYVRMALCPMPTGNMTAGGAQPVTLTLPGDVAATSTTCQAVLNFPATLGEEIDVYRVSLVPAVVTVPVVNVGSRDTPIVAALTGPMAVPNIGGVQFGVSTLQYVIPSGTMSIDTGARLVSGVAPCTVSGGWLVQSGAAAQYVSAPLSRWKLLAAQANGVNVRGLMGGATVTVTVRNAY